MNRPPERFWRVAAVWAIRPGERLKTLMTPLARRILRVSHARTARRENGAGGTAEAGGLLGVGRGTGPPREGASPGVLADVARPADRSRRQDDRGSGAPEPHRRQASTRGAPGERRASPRAGHLV